jgi:hypothetical protein
VTSEEEGGKELLITMHGDRGGAGAVVANPSHGRKEGRGKKKAS